MTIPPPKSRRTILVTGANGSLGTAIALALCNNNTTTSSSTQQQQYLPPHLLLAARNPTDPSSQHLSTLLQALTPRPTFTWLALDLSSLSKIRAFATDVKARISAGEFPAFGHGGGIVNSAAMFSSVPVEDRAGRTEEGFDVNYGVNALAPVVLVRELLDVLGGGAVVVNVSSLAHTRGVVDYFHRAPGPSGGGGGGFPEAAVVDGKEASSSGKSEGKTLGVREVLSRYASSKLLLIMLGYALQRRLDTEKPSRDVQIVGLDPGGMSGPSHLGTNSYWAFRLMRAIATFLGPVVRLADRSAINPPSVPAEAIAALFRRQLNDERVAGKYFVLGSQVESCVLSRDVELQERVWKRAMEELKLSPDL